MSPALGTREIDDIGDTVLSFSEAKALATNNPLLMDKAQADADLARLVRAERAHHRNQDALRHAVTRHEQHIAAQTRLAADIDYAIARRQDTRGEAFTMTVDGQHHDKRAEAGHHLLQLLRQEAAQPDTRQRTVRAGELAAFPLTASVSRRMGQAYLTLAFDGAPRTEMTLSQGDFAEADPVGIVTRLENRLARLETNKAEALAEIEHGRTEIQHATATIGKPFPQATELAAARERTRQVYELLEAAAAPPQAHDAETQTKGTIVPSRPKAPLPAQRAGRQAADASSCADPHRAFQHDIDGTAHGRRLGSAIPQYREAEERRHPAIRNDRQAHDREAGE